MKGVLVILDGLGDLPHSVLGEKTPLEAAATPNLDFLASRGELGFMYNVKKGFIPESDEGILSIFGNNLADSSRGQLEARGAGLKLVRGDLVFRTNFATIDSFQKGNIVDRRAGRTLTTGEAETLAKAINKIKVSSKFIFKPTIQHRGVLVFKGGFSDDISCSDSTYFQGKALETRKVRACRATDDEENSQYTANIVNEFLEKVFETLDNHPINVQRRKKGLMPANFLLVRGQGAELPKLNQFKKWMAFTYMPVEIGFSLFSGMKVFSFDYPELKNLDSYTNLWDGLKKACENSINILKKKYKDFDYAYIHIKETDLPGHDNKPVEKKLMIEYIDSSLFRFLREFAPPNNIRVAVTGDHSTPCKLKSHSEDPVPVLLYNNSIPREKHFNEKEARKGALGEMTGREFLRKIGFLR
jgi:2,3-bisphosphoglycerate-independent phosphoglycerate mutase